MRVSNHPRSTHLKPAGARNRGLGVDVLTEKSSRKLKVLSIHWGFGVGGVVKYAEAIDRVGDYAPIHIITLCVRGRRWICDHETLRRLSPIEIVIRSRFDPSWIWRVPHKIGQIDPDLIMTHGFNGHIVALLMRLMSRQPYPLICSYHGRYHPFTRLRRFVAKAIDTFVAGYIRHKATGAVCVSEYSKRNLMNAGVRKAKITVIHNGISESSGSVDETRCKLRGEWRIRDDEILVGTAARLDPIKGIVHLIDAFREVAKRIHKVKLAIVGTGPLEGSLKEYVREIELSDRIIFAGSRSDVEDCLLAMDIYVLPSLEENHSIALLEAMRARKGIIATNVGGNTESVRHAQEALIVPPADVAALSESIERLAKDVSLRQKLSDAAYDRFLQKFTREQMVRRTAEWICTMADPKRPAG